MDKVVVGIDVSKDWLDVHVAPSGEHFRVGNDHAGVEALAARLSSHGPDMVALEATGGCEHVAVAALSAAGLAVVVVNPAQVRAYANALGKHAKTDPIAAAVIAAFVEAAKPDIRPLKDKVARVFGELVTRRRQIVQMMVAEENRERMAAPGARKSIRHILTALRRELESLDQIWTTGSANHRCGGCVRGY